LPKGDSVRKAERINNISGKRYIDHWIEAGFECATPIKNSGAGAALRKKLAGRRF